MSTTTQETPATLESRPGIFRSKLDRIAHESAEGNQEPAAVNRLGLMELRAVLGGDVILFPLPKYSKVPRKGETWSEVTQADMADLTYLHRLQRAHNLAVVLGSRSGGLCSVDMDSHDDLGQFLALNPGLRSSLITTAKRGGNVWVRMVSSYPPSRPLCIGSRKVGEWRADGNYTVISGTHPEGFLYQFVNRANPVEIRFNEIRFAEETIGDLSVAKNRPITSVPLCSPLLHSVPLCNITIEQAVAMAVPTDFHQNHHSLFTLARAIRAIEEAHGKRSSGTQLEKIFDFWREEAKRFLRHSREDYLCEFLEAYDCVRFPLGDGALKQAWARANSTEVPREAMRLENPELRLLVNLCRELQRNAGEEPFFLATRTAAGLLGHSAPVQANRWLNLLVRLGFLEIVTKGGPATGRATRYRYLLPI